MAKKYTDEFRRDAVRMATTSGLTRPQLSSDLGVGVSDGCQSMASRSPPLMHVNMHCRGSG
jgi:hypothetical protein